GRHQGQALRPAPRQGHDPPALEPGHRRPGLRRRDRDEGDPQGEEAAQRDPGPAHRPAVRPDRGGDRAQPLLHRPGGQGLRPGRRRAGQDGPRQEGPLTGPRTRRLPTPPGQAGWGRGPVATRPEGCQGGAVKGPAGPVAEFAHLPSTRLPINPERAGLASAGHRAPLTWRNRAMPLVPYVVERSGREERVFDIYSRLLKDRIIFLQGEIDDDSANLIVAQMLFLQFDDPKADIHLYINSPGGSVTAGLSIYDTMHYVTCD